MLTKGNQEFYEENGYLILPRVFDDSECVAMKMTAEGMHGPDYEVYLNIHRDSKYFFNIARSRALLSIVEGVMKEPFDITNDQYLYKRPGTAYAKQSWSPHQDAAYVNAPRDTYLQVHVLLDDQSPENGGLYYYPKSHKEPLLPYVYTKSWREEPDEDGVTHPGWKVEVPDKYKRTDLRASRGSVFVQHGNLIHGSYPNLSERPRAQFSVAYLQKNTKINKGRDSIKIPIGVK